MSGNNGAGKGDKYRPVNQKKFDLGYIMIYGTKKEKEEAKKQWEKLKKKK